MDIRLVITEDDWQALRHLSYALQAHESNLWPNRKPLDDYFAGSFNYIRRHVADAQGAAFIAQDKTGTIIGFMVGWLEDSDGLDQGTAQVGSISDAYIIPTARGQVAFKKLTFAMAQHFKGQGVDRITFQTLGQNIQMQNILLKRGFKPHKVTFEVPLEKLL